MNIYKILPTLIVLSLLSGCSDNLGADIKLVTLEEKINTEKTAINSIQATQISKEGKYKRIDEYEKDGVKYRVIEYVTPDGSKGYQIISSSNGYIKSIGYGKEAESRTYIKEPNIVVATTSIEIKK